MSSLSDDISYNISNMDKIILYDYIWLIDTDINFYINIGVTKTNHEISDGNFIGAITHINNLRKERNVSIVIPDSEEFLYLNNIYSAMFMEVDTHKYKRYNDLLNIQRQKSIYDEMQSNEHEEQKNDDLLNN